jgi:hypothetical protein
MLPTVRKDSRDVSETPRELLLTAPAYDMIAATATLLSPASGRRLRREDGLRFHAGFASLEAQLQLGESPP